MAVEQRSRGVLASWAACCLVDAAARSAHPQLERFSLPLQYADLRWLSLADGLALDALQAVCAYLRERARGNKPCCFSLRRGDATQRLAEEVARASPWLCERWAAENEHAVTRRRLHWEEVQRKQQGAKVLPAGEAEGGEGEGARCQGRLGEGAQGGVGPRVFQQRPLGTARVVTAW